MAPEPPIYTNFLNIFYKFHASINSLMGRAIILFTNNPSTNMHLLQHVSQPLTISKSTCH